MKTHHHTDHGYEFQLNEEHSTGHVQVFLKREDESYCYLFTAESLGIAIQEIGARTAIADLLQ